MGHNRVCNDDGEGEIAVNEEIVQYYVVNRELSMSPGKLAAQAA
jgi:hypothetical protein